MTVSDYVDGICSGNRGILGRALTLVESSLPSHRELARSLVEECAKATSADSYRIAITGSPGVGKSTFIEALGKQLTALGKRVAVLPIDPSSERSGGSILGDKTRMLELAADPKAFIRPSPSRLHAGGVARHTFEAMLLCEAAGYDVVLVETVGVGQSDTAVSRMVDFVLLLMLPNSGDDLQMLKRGITEDADAIVITKADGSDAVSAEIARSRYSWALSAMRHRVDGWTPPVEICSALQNKNIIRIWQVALEFHKALGPDAIQRLRDQHYLDWVSCQPSI